ncbi:MAG: radical SAM protein [Bacteroidia bacterium]
MAILFGDIVFGPLKSRRFGVSLGINLLPLDNKVCNFNCIYCECGWTDLKSVDVKYLPPEEITSAMKERFKEIAAGNKHIDSITFAGNGEPTMHPQFAEIMDNTVSLRNQFLPGVKITVLSNAALLGKEKVFNALLKADLPVLKLDAGTNEMFRRIDKPLSSKNIDWYISNLKKFNGKLAVQTLFLQGEYERKTVDNTTPEEITAWIMALKEINPKQVMIYTLDRETPAQNLHKVSSEKLQEICNRAKQEGINAVVYE